MQQFHCSTSVLSKIFHLKQAHMYTGSCADFCFTFTPGVSNICTTIPRCILYVYHHSLVYSIFVPPFLGVSNISTTIPWCILYLYHHSLVYSIFVQPFLGVSYISTTIPWCILYLYHHSLSLNLHSASF